MANRSDGTEAIAQAGLRGRLGGEMDGPEAIGSGRAQADVEAGERRGQLEAAACGGGPATCGPSAG